ncbi:MAG: purine-nucleoside phosphorylase [Bacilli bacterium]|nr:purine-nucleoside phosphorylase [Bacilli bacterium]
MKPQDQPIHINAKKDDIAPIVILPGDPLRAKYIAENFLDNAKEVTNVRNMLGFTGTYKGTRVTVMGSGMGMPSCGIYVFELFYYYNVQKIIRIGTCGVSSPKVEIPEIILADKVYSESNFAFSYNGYKENVVVPSQNLVNNIEKCAKEKGLKIHKGTIMTTDVFGPYVDDDALMARVPQGLDILGEEMESFGLIHVANSFNREAAVLVTAVDSKFSDTIVSVEDRQTSLNDMIGLALDSLSSSNI